MSSSVYSKRLHKPVEYHVVFLPVAEKRLHHIVQYVENPEKCIGFIKKRKSNYIENAGDNQCDSDPDTEPDPGSGSGINWVCGFGL
jgi:hypothetical protein